MADLTTSYMGLKLRNPIIVSSSDLTGTASRIMQCDESGAGAVVLKSIFEEQFKMRGDIPEGDYGGHPEALDYLRGVLEIVKAAGGLTSDPFVLRTANRLAKFISQSHSK